MKVFRLSLVTAIVLLGLSACGGESANQSAQPTSAASSSPSAMKPSASPSAMKSSGAVTKIDVAETEMKIVLSPSTVAAGPVDFMVHNSGEKPHELVVFKTTLGLDQLPTKDGKLDEESKKLVNVADTGEKDLKSGEMKNLRATLTPGHYVVICNVGNHFKRGMKADLTVQ